MKLLLIGHARHGKDTVAEIIQKYYGIEFQSSSQAAADIFIFDKLKEEFGYDTPEECFEDRVHHRKLWHDLICDYNKFDKARLAKAIMDDADMYVGMRSSLEIEQCRKINLFDMVIGVYDPRKPLEPKDSFDIDLWTDADFMIPNGGTLAQLDEKVQWVFRLIYDAKWRAEEERVNRDNGTFGRYDY